MKILVIGGAGYIGAHCAHLAASQGHKISIFDDFSSGHRWACSYFPVFVGNILDEDYLTHCMRGFDAVFHCAAKIAVSESVERPDWYALNNVEGTASILNAMTKNSCNVLAFSSTAAVYGIPSESRPLIELDRTNPINPYGQSKVVAENQITEWAKTKGRSATIFRYFNAAGARVDWRVGELHDPETHLIPNMINSLLNPDEHTFKLFGCDYPTHDGSCIRDYVHVSDIASAHSLALEKRRLGCRIFNLGHGSGYSNLEVMQACADAVGVPLRYEVSSRRPGDSPALTTSNEWAKADLGWIPKKSDLKTIVGDAVRWHRDILPEIKAK